MPEEKKLESLTHEEMVNILKREPEVSAEFGARYLGLTTRMVTNYCKSRQLEAEKVGPKWFIKSPSLLSFRAAGQSLADVVFPQLENRLSQHQEESRKKDNPRANTWELKKGPKRTPRKLGCFSKLEECFQLLQSLEKELAPADFAFFRDELLVLGDDLGAGFYSYGPLKRQLYGRARLRAGRLVARALLRPQPHGFVVCLSHVVEAISSLCKSMEKSRAA